MGLTGAILVFVLAADTREGLDGTWKLSRNCSGGIRLPRKLENQTDKVMAGLARL